MSLIKTEMGDKSNCKIEFSVDKETFEAAINKVYRKQIGKMNVPGFRKGKAPRNIVEKMYGKTVFYEDAMNEVIPDAFDAAVKEADLKVVGQPKFDVVSMDGDIVFSAEVDLDPVVEIVDYKGIKVEKSVAAVTDEELENEINIVRQRNGREITIDNAPAEMGNTVNIDYEGSVDGVPFEGGKAEGYSLKLGSGQFIPGFEDQIAGHNIGDEFDVNVTFPTEYHAPELAGKAAVFKTKLNGITKVELPELDDDFAKDVSEFDTMDEYRADLKAKIQKRHEDSADRELTNKLNEALIEKITTPIPESFITAEIENIIRDYDYNFRSQGFDLNTYLKYTNSTLEQFRENVKPDAEKRVKLQLALEKIAELENITVTDEDYEEEYANIAKAYNMDVEQVKASISKDNLDYGIKTRKTSAFVKDNAAIVKPVTRKKKKTTETTESTES